MKIKALIPEKYTPRSIDRCIYCGSVENLSDEHIVPRGLGGPWKLLNASCRECAEITSGFEREVVHDYFKLVRAKLGLPTYHPQNRPTSFTFSVKTDDKEEITNFPVSDCPTLFMMPIFEKPGYIINDKQRKGILVSGMCLHGRGLKEFAKEQNIKSISFTGNFSTSFSRVLAKIAYGMVIHQHGLGIVQDAYVLPCILGKKDDVGQWVGCEYPHKSPSLLPKEELFHKIEVLSQNNEVGARIRLFANYETPEYLVIVGRLK